MYAFLDVLKLSRNSVPFLFVLCSFLPLVSVNQELIGFLVVCVIIWLELGYSPIPFIAFNKSNIADVQLTANFI